MPTHTPEERRRRQRAQQNVRTRGRPPQGQNQGASMQGPPVQSMMGGQQQGAPQTGPRLEDFQRNMQTGRSDDELLRIMRESGDFQDQTRQESIAHARASSEFHNNIVPGNRQAPPGLLDQMRGADQQSTQQRNARIQNNPTRNTGPPVQTLLGQVNQQDRRIPETAEGIKQEAVIRARQRRIHGDEPLSDFQRARIRARQVQAASDAQESAAQRNALNQQAAQTGLTRAETDATRMEGRSELEGPRLELEGTRRTAQATERAAESRSQGQIGAAGERARGQIESARESAQGQIGAAEERNRPQIQEIQLMREAQQREFAQQDAQRAASEVDPDELQSLADSLGVSVAELPDHPEFQGLVSLAQQEGITLNELIQSRPDDSGTQQAPQGDTGLGEQIGSGARSYADFWWGLPGDFARGFTQ